ncbi:adenosylmethionine decarboxylase [Neobacillus kokaensis]|uniref:S-adenosylmethionine decarboxylase proenzyme n=1 Tax=Neobacillus kokaensis TaxID=2759023 RepID=A0ABQ3NAN3_9BACI|nr:adenosylmethionine decarboxylase [Neobacillus kokaensis]GHI00961.1 hypothetical protein AM1BK_45030 [Neobacillus kokaensis]
MEIKGQHLIVDAYDCQVELINNADDLKRLMLETLRELQLEVLLAYFHSFSPQGVTGIVAISTSHFSIHTWPEYGYSALDLYTCSPMDALPALKKFLGKIGAGRANIYEIKRGMEGLIFTNREGDKLLHSAGRRRGDKWDWKILKEIKNGNHPILFKGKSKFHDILLVEAKDLRLYMNDQLQFSSLDEKHYHEALVLPVMELAPSREHVLILGGGDGFALREVLKYPDVFHVDLVDIDPMIIHLAKNERALVTANHGSLKDNRVTVHTMDAREYVNGNNKGYDVVIIDFPDPADHDTSLLYTKEFFEHVARHLNTEGLLACQANSPKGTPKVYWSIGKTLQASGFKTKPYFTLVPSFGVWGFYLVSRKSILKKLPELSVPHQAINSNLELLPPTLHSPQTGLIINSENNLRLHELYQEEIEKI